MNKHETTAELSRRRAQGMVAALALFGVLAVVVFALPDGYGQTRAIRLARQSGWLAVWALGLSLGMTPLARTLAALRRPVAFEISVLRRSFGIAAACLGLAHALWAQLGWLRGDPRLLYAWPHLRAGLLALLCLLALLLTSFPGVLHVPRIWKELHRLAYVAAALVFGHLLLAPFASRDGMIVLLVGVVGMQVLRFLPPPRT